MSVPGLHSLVVGWLVHWTGGCYFILTSKSWVLDNACSLGYINIDEKINQRLSCMHNGWAGNSTIARHKKIIHKGVKFPCRQCNHQATSKEILLNTKEQYMKELNFPVGNATMKQHQKEILLDTKEKYMKESNILVGNATIKQHQKGILLNI